MEKYFVPGNVYERKLIDNFLGKPISDVNTLFYPEKEGTYVFNDTDKGFVFQGIENVSDTKLIFLSKSWQNRD